MKIKQILFFFAGIIGFSFLLNFLWESLHAYSLYEDHVIGSDEYIKMMVHMSLGDAITIFVIYLFVSTLNKNIFWLKDMNKKTIVLFFIFGLIAAVAAEYWAVYIKKLWIYNDNMPVLFGIGLSPMVQLSVTGLAAIWIVKRMSSEE
ncbi:MAG: hypothetical protein KC618_07235 [Candidatus Omnitrophica bacterium]|nr:hypothetical protein [Candidatus Omnitrophota bacterium]